MEVIVNEDQLSLAIGKRGQNVRLATKLVGWNIDIRSEEELKKEVAEQMGAMIASGAPVPLSAIEGVTTQQADALAEHGVTDIDGLAGTSVDDLVEFLDVSLDEAEIILNAAHAVIAMRNQSLQPAAAEDGAESEATPADADVESVEQHAASAELGENIVATDVDVSDEMTAAGYDEAVEQGVPYSVEQNIRAEYSADPVALTQADPISVDELLLQEVGRDLRPDVITPAPDVTSTAVADLAAAEPEEAASEESDAALVDSSNEAQTSSALESSSSEEAATDESLKDEKQ